MRYPFPLNVRVVFGIAGFLLAAIASDAFVWLAFARPLPFLSVVLSLTFFLAAVGLMSLALGTLRIQKKRLVLIVALCLGIVSHFAKLLCPFCYAVAAEHARGTAEHLNVKALVIERSLSGTDPFAHSRDRWGGQYHLKELADNTLLVWSDGPDGDNDNAEIQVAEKLFAFERAFEPCFTQPYEAWLGFLRRAALWEVTSIWRQLNGDIVWESKDGAVVLKS